MPLVNRIYQYDEPVFKQSKIYSIQISNSTSFASVGKQEPLEKFFFN